jgi:hypothetical protein
MRDRLLAVCNLVTGTLDVLPRLEQEHVVHHHEMTGYALLTPADYPSSNDDEHEHPRFKVLVIGMSGSTKKYRLRTFLSGEPGWSMCSGIMEGRHIDMALMQHNAVVCGGMARWFYRGRGTAFSRIYGWRAATFYTLDVSAESGDVFFTNQLSISYHLMNGLKYEESFFSVDKEGRVALVCLQREGLQLKMWTWKDKERLPDARVLMLQQPYQQKSEIGVVYTVAKDKNNLR